MRGIPNEIGSTLRALRKQRGIGVRTLARAIGRTPSWISKVETGLLYPSEEFILAVAPGLKLDRRKKAELLALLALYETEHHSVRDDGSALSKQQRALAQLFKGARVVRSFHAMIIAGVLQTDGYAKAIFEKGAPGTSWELAMRNRVKWQKFLDDPTKEFTFVFHENALRFLVSSTSAMACQIEHLRSLRKRVRIRLITRGTELPVVPPTDFTIFDDHLVVVDTAAGVMTFRRPEHVDQYAEIIGSLEREAVPESRLDGELARILNEI